MKLESSIVIIKNRDYNTQDIDLVLRVKHPQGTNPVERIHQAIQEFLSSPAGRHALEMQPEYTWSDLLDWMSEWDWSTHGLYIEDVLSWVVFEPQESCMAVV